MLRRRRLTILVPTAALALASLLDPAAGFGDEIVLKTGTKYEGRIISEDATHYVIETRDLGKLRIAKSEVSRAKTQEPAAAAPAKPAGKADAAAPGKGEAAAKGETPGKGETPAKGDAAAKGEKPDGGGAAPKPDGSTKPEPAAGAEPRADGTVPPAGGGAPAKEPPKPVDPEEEARKRAEQEALDAAARLARRKAATLKRRTDPGAEKVVTTAAPNESDLRREKERESMGGAELAAAETGTPVIVFEPPRPFAPAPSGIALGRRTFARFEQGGAASASLTVTIADQPQRMTIRLADVQRHVSARNEGARVRILEGINEGDWLRLRMADGSALEGRCFSIEDALLRLRVPAAEAAPRGVDVDVTKIVQVDGLIASPSIARLLYELEAQEPVGFVRWPDGKETIGRFCDRMEYHLRIDTDADGEPDVLIPTDAPLAEVRRIPASWRQAAREMPVGADVRLRGFEDYADARVERVFTASLASITAFAISVRLDDGCAVVPFEALVSFDRATSADVKGAALRLEPAALDLPVLPGAKAAEAQALKLPEGIAFVTDGRVVTNVYVSPAYSRTVCGVQVGAPAAKTLAYSELHFGTEVIPKGESGERRRELISETVNGIRVTASVDAKGNVTAVQLSAR